MTRAAKLNRLNVLYYLGHSPYPLVAALLGIPEHKVLHNLQKGLRA